MSPHSRSSNHQKCHSASTKHSVSRFFLVSARAYAGAQCAHIFCHRFWKNSLVGPLELHFLWHPTTRKCHFCTCGARKWQKLKIKRVFFMIFVSRRHYFIAIQVISVSRNITFWVWVLKELLGWKFPIFVIWLNLAKIAQISDFFIFSELSW